MFWAESAWLAALKKLETHFFVATKAASDLFGTPMETPAEDSTAKKGKGVAYVQFPAILILIALAVTNPSVDDHKAAIDNAFREEAMESPEAILIGALNQFIEGIGASMFQYGNYGVCSVLRNEEEVVSFGILGNVWFVGEFR
ncbi:MAG: hypothetical protein ACI8QI_001069 [Limisphaerales bacterium]